MNHDEVTNMTTKNETTTTGGLTPAQLEQRASAGLRHGARSDNQIRPLARTQKRRLLRQIGLRASDIEGLGLAYLDNWARAQSKVELMDRWVDEHGWIDADGNPPGFVAVYFAAVNTARLSLAKLADYMRAERIGEPSVLAALRAQSRGDTIEFPAARGDRS